jgi:phospholipid/cholesterol/gamma-HCH transport system substrate-binding protein
VTPRFTVMEKIVGVFILLTFLLFLGTMVLVGRGQNWFKQHNTYYALYKEGYNLQPGVKVKLLKTDIGQVTAVELTEENKAKVTMKILAGYASRIREDSRAAIESPTLIGSEYINILPGTSATAAIMPGHEIPSKEAKTISDYLEEFDLEHKMLLIDEILENIANITDELQRPDSGLLGAINNVERISGEVAQGEGSLGKRIYKTELYDKILGELDALNKIMKNVDKASRTLNSIMKAVDTGAVSVRKGAKSVEDVTAQLNADVPDILGKVQTILTELETAMYDVPDISSQARQGMRDVNDILESVKKNFLIRGNLPEPQTPESHGLEIRGE